MGKEMGRDLGMGEGVGVGRDLGMGEGVEKSWEWEEIIGNEELEETP